MSESITLAERLGKVLSGYSTGTMDEDKAILLIEELSREFGLPVDDWGISETDTSIVIYTGDHDKLVEFYLGDGGTVNGMSFDENALSHVMKFMTCPSCETGKLEHRQVANGTGMDDGMTHVFVCDHCPIVMLEYIGEYDLVALPKALR